eukprot:gene19471-23322_t
MAVKSNPIMSLMKEAVKCGLGAEVASFGELKIAELAGFPSDKIIFDSPIKSIKELEYAIDMGVKINVDNFQEMERVVKIVETLSDAKREGLVIGIRINPQVAAGKLVDLSTGVPTSKFGIGMESRDQIKECYSRYSWLRGVHLHVGSQGFEMDQASSAILKVFEFVKEINSETNNQIKYFNIGGGLSVNFESEMYQPTFTDYADHLKERIPELFNGDYTIITEFGRSYFAKCCVAVSTVEYTKQSGGRDIAVIHAGANLYIRTIYHPNLWKLRVTLFDGQTATYKDGKNGSSIYDLAGPCCFAADLLAKERRLPRINQDDLVMIHDSGAYFHSSYSHYNLRLAPPVYGWETDGSLKLIKKGETLEEKINFFS